MAKKVDQDEDGVKGRILTQEEKDDLTMEPLVLDNPNLPARRTELGQSSPARMLAPQDVTQLIRDLAGTVDADSLKKLVDMQYIAEDRAAERAFNEALAAFQSECPSIAKTSKVLQKDKKATRYSFVSLEDLQMQIQPLLDANGLTLSDSTTMTDNQVICTMTIRHRMGHKEEVTFPAPIDKDAYMNNTQKAASAASYARRYCRFLGLGITTGDFDDDGKSAGELEPISVDQSQTIKDLVSEFPKEKHAEIYRRMLKMAGAENVDEIQRFRYATIVNTLRAKAPQDSK